MMPTQRFSNNANTILAAQLLAGATQMTVSSASDFTTITAPEYELVTLQNDDYVEIVRVIARVGTTWSITRGQEGTIARDWATGTRVEARITAATLNGFLQSAAATDIAALNSEGNPRGGSSVNLQPGRATVSNIASGTRAVAVGYDSKASGFQNSIAVGVSAVASGSAGTAIGASAVASGQDSVALGTSSSASDVYAIAVGKSASASNSGVALGQATVSGMAGVSIGNAAVGTRSAIAVGSRASSQSAPWGDSGVAIGVSSKVLAAAGVAIGYNAIAKDEETIAIGKKVRGAANRAIYINGFPVIPNDDWDDQYEHATSGGRASFATPYVDLAVPPAWEAAKTYKHGDVVRPTTGGTVQYRVWAPFSEDTFVHYNALSTPTEPVWPGAGSDVGLDADYDAYWLGIDWNAGYLLEAVPAWLMFIPTEVCFLCYEFSALTGTISVSVGTSSYPTSIVNNATLTITDTNRAFTFTTPNPTPIINAGEQAQIKVNSFASAGKCLGRFIVSGYFVDVRFRE